MTPATYRIPDHYRGDTFDAITFTIKEDGTDVDLTGAAIKIDFRKDSITGSLQKSMSIGSGITIVDAVGGEFKLDSYINNWAAQTYYYDTQITFSDGIVRTYFKGTLKVDQDGTHG
tara:strand:- start:813 stop:1160 length:348 start_codon:yes stop_codon:yes gene_type:complete